MRYIKLFENFILENSSLLDNILDKINSDGITSLNKSELKYLDQYSKNNINPDLEKALQVDSGYVFVSKNIQIPLLKFEYDETEEYEDGQMLHKGTIYFNDLEFSGEIYCDEDGKYQGYEFYTYEKQDDDTFDQIDDLTDYDDEVDGMIEKFLKSEVCPYLTYSI